MEQGQYKQQLYHIELFCLVFFSKTRKLNLKLDRNPERVCENIKVSMFLKLEEITSQ